MLVSLPFIWIIFTILFILLGRYYWQESQKTIPHFTLAQRKFAKNDSPFQAYVEVCGTPLDQPLEDFSNQFNKYLDEQNTLAQKINRRAAFGYYLAAATALLSALIECLV